MGYLLALDLDGTLLKDDKTISERTLNTLHMCKKKGDKILITTGRARRGIQKYISALGMGSKGDYAICANGAVTYDLCTGRQIDQCMPDREDIEWLYHWAIEVGANLQFLSENVLYTMRAEEYPAIEAKHNCLDMMPLGDRLPPDDVPIYKVMCIDLVENIAQLRHSLPEQIKTKFQYIESSPFYLEFLHPSAGKVRGIQKVMDIYGMERSKVVAFGDAGNDMEMIRYAGLGVAMGNASDELKLTADRITETNEEDGVALILEELHAKGICI